MSLYGIQNLFGGNTVKKLNNVSMFKNGNILSVREQSKVMPMTTINITMTTMALMMIITVMVIMMTLILN